MENNIKTNEEKALLFLAFIFFVIFVFLYIYKSHADKSIVLERGVIGYQYSMAQVEEFIMAQKKIDIQTASKEDLEKIPGIGKVIAERIVSKREQEGHISAGELDAIKGISQGKEDKIREYLL